MLVHDIFDEAPHRIKVDGGGIHYFNKIKGHYIDLTREQFDLYGIPTSNEPNEEMDREYFGKNADTKSWYKLFVRCLPNIFSLLIKLWAAMRSSRARSG